MVTQPNKTLFLKLIQIIIVNNIYNSIRKVILKKLKQTHSGDKMQSLTNRRDFLKYTAGMISALSLGSCSESLPTKKVLPNIVLVITDDQGYGDLGIKGNPHLKTPNLDRFAGESTEFSRFYCEPMCAPHPFEPSDRKILLPDRSDAYLAWRFQNVRR